MADVVPAAAVALTGQSPPTERSTEQLMQEELEAKSRAKAAQQAGNVEAVKKAAAEANLIGQEIKIRQAEDLKASRIKGKDKPIALPTVGENVQDVGRAIKSAFPAGVRGMPGMLGSLAGLAADAGTWAANQLAPGDDPLPDTFALPTRAVDRVMPHAQGPLRPGLGDQLKADPFVRDTRAFVDRWSSPAFVEAARERGEIPPDYETKSGLGEVAKVAAEGAGGSLIPYAAPAKTLNLLTHAKPLARTLFTQGAVPGAAGEIAGQSAERLGFENAATAARVGTSLVTGFGAGAYANRQGGGASAVSREMQNATDAQIDAAEALVTAARERGVALSRAQALDAVTKGGTALSTLQASIEALPGNNLRAGLAGQPEAMEAMAKRELDRAFGQPPSHPSVVDRRINEAVGEIRANSVPGQQLTDEIARAAGGPGAPMAGRTSPETAGNVIQPQLTGRLDQLRQARAAQARRDYGQAYASVGGLDISPIDNALTAAIDSQIQKGPAATTLERAREMLRRGDDPETRIEALHNSRRAIDGMIAAETDTNNIRLLTGVRNDLAQALDQVPGFRQADANFQRASRHIEPLESGALGEITAQERTATRPTMHPADVPAALEKGGVQAVDQLRQALPGPRSASGEAYSRHLATQWLDDAGRGIDTTGRGHQVSAAKLRERLTSDEDLLKRTPGLRDQLTRIIDAREQLERNGLSGRLRQLYLQGESTTVQAVNKLFPLNAHPGALPELQDAVRLLNQRDPQGARQLMSTWLNERLNRAMGTTQSGSQAMSGANFANAVAGNPAQKAELLEGIRIVAGDDAAKGFEKVLEIQAASGRRQGQGSPTALRKQLYEELGENVPADVGVAAIGAAAGEPLITGYKLTNLARGFTDRFMREASGRQIADLLLNPAAAAQFKALGKAGTEARTQIALNRLGVLTARTAAQEANR